MSQLHVFDETLIPPRWRPLTPADLAAGSGGGSSSLTNAELRAAAVPVTGPLTDVQLRAGALAVSSAAIGTVGDAAANADSGAFSLLALIQRLLSKLPSTLGIKTAANSLSMAPASDAVFTTGGTTTNPAGAAMIRPASATVYASGQLVGNSASAGSVTATALTLTRIAAGAGIIRRLRLRKSGTTLANASFRVHLFSAQPAISVADAGTFATGVSGISGYIGHGDITMDTALSDGSFGATDATFTDLNIRLAAGQTIYYLIEARAAYSSSASEAFYLTAEVFQD